MTHPQGMPVRRRSTADSNMQGRAEIHGRRAGCTRAMSDGYLLHVTEADRWSAGLSNVNNLCQLGLAENVIVLINGTGIYAIQGNNDWTQAMSCAADQGVRFEVCERSLTNHGFPAGSIPNFIHPIWAAVPVIAGHVADGFTYIKP